MSHPDPQHDDELSRLDDDLLRDEMDARRREDELAQEAERKRIRRENEYAAAMIERDKLEPAYVRNARDLTTDGASMDYATSQFLQSRRT